MKKTLLLVEDEAIIAKLEMGQLRAAGYEVLHALNGETAVEIVCGTGKTVDLILMDIDLGPGMDGTEAAVEILKSRTVPVVFLSSHTEREIVEKTEKITSYGYVVKNSGETVLLTSIKMAFKLFDAHKSLEASKEGLQRGENYLATTLNSIGDAVITTDLGGRVVRMNPVAENLTGWKGEEAQGRPLAEVFPIVNAKTRLPAEDPVRKVLETGKIVALANHTALISRGGTEYQIADSAAPIQGENRRVMGVVLVFRDVTDQYRAREVLRESEANLREAQQIAGLGRWELDLIKNRLEWSDTIFEIFEIDRERFGVSYEAFLAAVHPDDRGSVDEAYTESLRTRAPYKIEHRLLMNDGRIKWVTERCRTEYNSDGKPLRSVGIVQDITEWKAAQKDLEDKNHFIQAILDNIPLGLAVNEFNSGKTTYINDIFAGIYGWPKEQLVDIPRFFELVYPEREYRREIMSRILGDIKSGDPDRMKWENIRITTQQGETRYIAASNIPILSQNIMVSTVRDVTERVTTEEHLRAMAVEKDILMKELQHRVKNNLAVIESLLSLETQKIVDEKAKSVFTDARTRIRSMIELYDRVYRSENLSHIDLDTYLQDLAESLFTTYNISSKEILLRTAFSPVGLDLKRAVPAGLILNELLTNALKYAYPRGTEGEIRITLGSKGDHIILVIEDDGVGLPSDFILDGVNSTGLLLVKTLSEQIGGKLDLRGPPGTRVALSFPL